MKTFKTYSLWLIAVILACGSCAISPKSETVAQGGDARTGTSEVATLRAEKAELAAAKVTAERDAKAALALVEKMQAEITAMKTQATAGRDLQLETAVAKIEASMADQKSFVTGAVGEMKAAIINNRNTNIYGMTGWQVIAGVAVCMVILLTFYFVASKAWNTRQIEKHEERAAEKVAAAVVNATK